MAEEITIPVPWGHISGKLSGSIGAQTVLCLHGLQDNCGSFDRLLPLLPKGFQYVAIDLPGHGMSSHFPQGLPIVYTHFIYSIKLIIDYYKWKKVIFLSHSFGAQLSTIFAAFYPEYCEKLIVLDGILSRIIPNNALIRYFRKHFDEMQKVDEIITNKKPPSYSYEEALNRFMRSRFSHLTNESAEILIKRSLIKSGNGFRFSTDQRLKRLFSSAMNKEQIKSVLYAIECPSLFLIAEDTANMFIGNSKDINKFGEKYLKRFEVVKSNINIKIIKGNHDVHLNNSPVVAECVGPFLLFNKSSL